jgi:hypothetical protein
MVAIASTADSLQVQDKLVLQRVNTHSCISASSQPHPRESRWKERALEDNSKESAERLEDSYLSSSTLIKMSAAI